MMFIEQVREGSISSVRTACMSARSTRCPERSSSSRSQIRHPEALTTISISG